MPKTTYVWDELSDQVIEESEDGVVVAEYTYEPGLYGNLISQNRSGTTHYYHYDGRGDTVALTDDSGNITDTRDYDAWGNVIASTGSTPTPFLFVGQKGCNADSFSKTEAYYSRSRLYHSRTARWSSSDALRFIDGVNVYRYCRNSPVQFNDPSGTRTCAETCAIAPFSIPFNGGASVVCDTGNPEISCVCDFPLHITDPSRPNQPVITLPPGGCNGVFDNLAEFHERAHLTLGHVTCDGCADGLSLATLVPNLTIADAECALRHRDVKILKELLKSEKWRETQSPECIKYVEIYIRFQGDFIKKECGGIPLDELDKYDDWTFEDLERLRKRPLEKPKQGGCSCDRDALVFPVGRF